MKIELIISRMHLSNSRSWAQSKVEKLEVGESVILCCEKYTKVAKDLCEVMAFESVLELIENKIEKCTSYLDEKSEKNKAGIGGFVSVNRAFRLAVYRGLVMDLIQKRFGMLWENEVSILEMPYHD